MELKLIKGKKIFLVIFAFMQKNDFPVKKCLKIDIKAFLEQIPVTQYSQ